jgi:protein-disulfide isomerase-like protein with CxxC motif
VYKTYTKGLEVVKARVLARIRAEGGMQATVFIVKRAKEIFLAVKVTKARLTRLKGSKRRFVKLACT